MRSKLSKPTTIQIHALRLAVVRAQEDTPEAIKAAWQTLESKLSSLRGRKFYGVCLREQGESVYYAGFETLDDAEIQQLGFTTLSVKGGTYARIKLSDWHAHVDEIASIVADLQKTFHTDPDGTVLEHYRSASELHLLAAMSPEAEIHLVPYDPDWPSKFEEERIVLMAAIGSYVKGTIEHVGSTAIPNLVAKPVIDIMVGVESLSASRAALPILEALGYHYSPYREDVMHWLCKPSPQFRTHHLHLVPYQSPLWFDRIAFRDYLRTNSTDASEYAQLKKALAEKHRFDREAYTDAKEPFIRRILKLALAREQHYDLRRPQTTEEWIQYHAIRRQVLWERRGRYGVYDENHPDESLAGRYPLLFFYQGDAVGVIRVDIEGSKAIFRRVAIKEDIQRSGHGRVLLRLSEKFATESGCHQFYSFVSPDAVEFYEKCGFQRDPLEAGASDHVAMQKFVRR